MPLDDHEQKILEEIERQFYEDDPDLARAVSKIDRTPRVGLKLSIVGFVVGLGIVVALFTTQTVIALAGFLVMILSATGVVSGLKQRGWGQPASDRGSGENSLGSRGPFRRD